MKRFLFYVCVFMVLILKSTPFAVAQDLSGSTTVNITSDTAVVAKTKAINEARRNILISLLNKYTESNDLMNLISQTSDDDLTNFVKSTSIANERLSTTSYVADITMFFDNVAIKQWLDSNNVRNWIPILNSIEKFTVIIDTSNSLNDWINIQAIVKNDNINIETKTILGRQIIVDLPLNYRAKFTAAMREAGWNYSDSSGALQIWK